MLRPLAALAFLLLGAPPQETDFPKTVRDLVALLQDRVPAVRKKAEEDLARLGARALPILREEESRQGAGELKNKLGALIQKIDRLHRKAVASGGTLLVTLSAKGKPVSETLAQLQQMTSVPIDRSRIPADALATLEAKGISLWQAVDQVCKSNGDITWDVSEKGIDVRAEPYEKPFMATSSGFALILRGFELYKGRGGPVPQADYLNSRAYIAGPPEAVSTSAFLIYEAMADDKGTNLMKSPGGLVFKTTTGHYEQLPDPDPSRPLYESVADMRDPNPAKGATKVKLCKGTAFLRLALDLQRCIEIKGAAIKKGAKASAPTVAVEIQDVEVSGAEARLEVAITDKRIAGKKDKHMFNPETGGKVILRDSAGTILQVALEPMTGTSTMSGPDSPAVEQQTTNFKVKAKLASEAPLASFEIWEPAAIEEIKIPFEFRDVPITKAK